MIIDVTEIEGASRAFDFTIEADELAIEHPGFSLTGKVRIEGEVGKRASQVEAKGLIASEAEVECTRCLQPVSRPIAVHFDVSFVEAEHFTSEREHEVRVNDLDTDILASDHVDLKEIAREQILLNLPEQVFCRPDCKGLCAKCGADRNLIDCKCDETVPDPRWAALKDFRS